MLELGGELALVGGHLEVCLLAVDCHSKVLLERVNRLLESSVACEAPEGQHHNKNRYDDFRGLLVVGFPQEVHPVLEEDDQGDNDEDSHKRVLFCEIGMNSPQLDTDSLEHVVLASHVNVYLVELIFMNLVLFFRVGIEFRIAADFIAKQRMWAWDYLSKLLQLKGVVVDISVGSATRIVEVPLLLLELIYSAYDRLELLFKLILNRASLIRLEHLLGDWPIRLSKDS